MSLASPLRALGSALLMASVMGCSAKLSEADVEQALAQIDQAIVENNQGSSTKRKYLSDPPLVYREASADAPIGGKVGAAGR